MWRLENVVVIESGFEISCVPYCCWCVWQEHNANFVILYGTNPLLIIYEIVHKPDKSEAQVNKHHQNQGYVTEGNLLLSLEIYIIIWTTVSMSHVTIIML